MLRNQRGFSLVEIMIVLAIIGIIVGLMANRFAGGLDKAKEKQAKIMIKQLEDRLEMYNTDCSTYPSGDQGLEALISQPEGDPPCESWGPEPYMKKIPKDPWKRDFIYESDGAEYTIISLGKDKKEGGEGFDKDISSADL